MLLGERGHKALNLRSLDNSLLGTLLVLGLSLGVEGGLTGHNVLTDIIALVEVEKLADLGRALGTEAQRVVDVVRGESGDGVGADLDHHEVDDGEIRADDAAADRLALALTSAARAVARLTLLEEKAHTTGKEDTLLHGETLGVVSAGDAESVAGVQRILHVVTVDLRRHTLIVEASPEMQIEKHPQPQKKQNKTKQRTPVSDSRKR